MIRRSHDRKGGHMKKTDPRIDSYISKSADFAKPVLRHLRKLVHEGCPDAEETLKWSHPSFLHNGRILCGMAAFKAHCVFGFWHKEMAKILGKDGAKADEAMWSLGRITSLAHLPSDGKMRHYIKKAAKLNESEAPARPRPVRKPAAALPVPDDLAAALRKNRAAAATFERFSPSHRKEYIEWITEAKRDETREKRLATALEWLAKGKPRSWKYEKC
jgi:uncharacterized protein YdeI (YjbR/CyaY-like superfamily)